MYQYADLAQLRDMIELNEDFVGSNNIHLLNPNGQFGTRLMLGKDAASPRYILTNLNDLTTKLFHPDDAPLLKYLDDDGTPIEPMHYGSCLADDSGKWHIRHWVRLVNICPGI